MFILEKIYKSCSQSTELSNGCSGIGIGIERNHVVYSMKSLINSIYRSSLMHLQKQSANKWRNSMLSAVFIQLAHVNSIITYVYAPIAVAIPPAETNSNGSTCWSRIGCVGEIRILFLIKSSTQDFNHLQNKRRLTSGRSS